MTDEASTRRQDANGGSEPPAEPSTGRSAYPTDTSPSEDRSDATERRRPLMVTKFRRTPGRDTVALYYDDCGELTCKHRCASCGGPSRPDGGTCVRCMQSAPATAAEKPELVWQCTRCDLKLAGDPRFCWGCGHTVYRPTWEAETP